MEDPANLYKEFIDGLVCLKRSLSYQVKQINDGDFERAFHDPELIKLLQDLNPEQLRILVKLIDKVKSTVTHDILSYLYDEGYSLVKGEKKIALDAFGNPPYYDYVSRETGDEWSDLQWSNITE